MKKSQNPTESEMEILQILWHNGSCTVREVNEVLSEKKDVGYTTTLKIMQIMADKNIVLRDTSSRTHIYTAAIDQKNTQQSMLNKFITNTFAGSASSLVLQALGNHKTNDDELKEIKSLIEKIEKGHQ
ncbi:MAG: BlaI/MecI/CopY family transcriptional regulator [Saprospiraceae bacterium]